MLVGKHPEAHADVMKQFERRKVEKEYLTIVAGVPDREGGTPRARRAPADARTSPRQEPDAREPAKTAALRPPAPRPQETRTPLPPS